MAYDEDEMSEFPGPGTPWPPESGGQPPYGHPPGAPPPGGQPPYGPPPGQSPGQAPGRPPYGPPGPPPYGPPPGFPPAPGGPPPPPYGPPPGFPPGPGGPPGPPPGPGGFGPYGPPPGRPNRMPWIVGGVVVVVAAVALLLVFTLGGGGSSNDAKAAVDKLLNADVHKDVKAAQAITCEPLKSQIPDIFRNDPDKSYKIGKVTRKGDTATVPATIVDSENHSGTVLFKAKKQDGTWKVCDVASGEPGGEEGGTGGGTPPGNGPSAPQATSIPTGVPTGVPSLGGTICATPPNGGTPFCVTDSP